MTFIVLLLPILGAGPCYAKIGSTDSYMTVWKYFGQPDFTSANIAGLNQSGTKFDFEKAGRLNTISYADKPSCKSLLTYSEEFSLRIMQGWGYLSEEGVNFQMQGQQTVAPEQVTIVQVSQMVPQSEAQDPLKPVPRVQKGQVLNAIQGVPKAQAMELRRSMLRLVAGQTLNLKGEREKNGQPKINLHKMPWQDDPDPELMGNPALNVDRTKYKYVWEIGRAAQTDNRTILFNQMALILMAYKEWKQMQKMGGEGEGYVFMHSLNKSRTRLFESVYGATKFPKDWKKADNCILTFELSKIVQRLPARQISERVDHLIELSNGKIDDLQALEILEKNLTFYRNDLDFSLAGEEPEPIVLEDFSIFGYKTKMTAYLRQLNLDSVAAEAMYRYLLKFVQSETSEDEAFKGFAAIRNANQRFASNNAVHLSNLRENRAKADPRYVRAVITAAYSNYNREMEALAIVNPAESVWRARHQNLMVRTQSALIVQQLVALGGKAGSLMENGRQVYTVTFTTSLLQSLVEVSGATVSEGYWATRRLLGHPAQF